VQLLLLLVTGELVLQVGHHAGLVGAGESGLLSEAVLAAVEALAFLLELINSSGSESSLSGSMGVRVAAGGDSVLVGSSADALGVS